jgi:hypothetical protein
MRAELERKKRAEAVQTQSVCKYSCLDCPAVQHSESLRRFLRAIGISTHSVLVYEHKERRLDEVPDEEWRCLLDKCTTCTRVRCTETADVARHIRCAVVRRPLTADRLIGCFGDNIGCQKESVDKISPCMLTQ